jgi:molecular chaperone DnaK (HSP70)
MRPQMELLGDAQGRRALPVVVGFPQRDEVVLGWEARQLRGEHPELTLAHFTRLLGLSLDQAQRGGVLDAAGLPARGSSAGELLFEAHRRELTAARLVTLLLAELRAVASQALAQPVGDAVFSVPLGLTARQRQVLREAAGQAGWEGVSLVGCALGCPAGLGPRSASGARGRLRSRRDELRVLRAADRVAGRAAGARHGQRGGGRVDAARCRARGSGGGALRSSHRHRDLRARPAAWQLLLAACEDAKCQLSERNAVQVVAGELLEPSLLAEAQHSMGVT